MTLSKNIGRYIVLILSAMLFAQSTISYFTVQKLFHEGREFNASGQFDFDGHIQLQAANGVFNDLDFAEKIASRLRTQPNVTHAIPMAQLTSVVKTKKKLEIVDLRIIPAQYLPMIPYFEIEKPNFIPDENGLVLTLPIFGLHLEEDISFIFTDDNNEIRQTDIVRIKNFANAGSRISNHSVILSNENLLAPFNSIQLNYDVILWLKDKDTANSIKQDLMASLGSSLWVLTWQDRLRFTNQRHLMEQEYKMMHYDFGLRIGLSLLIFLIAFWLVLRSRTKLS